MPNPQVPVSGPIGPGGNFALLGSGTAEIAGNANLVLTYQQYVLFSLNVTSDGTSTGPRQVVLPLITGWQQQLKNSTSEGFPILAGGATGSTVSIPPGTTATVGCVDGANYQLLDSASTGMTLSRVIVTDGGSTAAPATGSIAAPYTSITAAFDTVKKPVSTEDANTVVQVWLAPCLGDYSENLTWPAYRNVYIQAITQDNNSDGTTIHGNLTLTNTAAEGGANPPSAGFYALTGVTVDGDWTITDDGTAACGVAILGGTTISTITGTGATELTFVEIDQESFVSTINCPSSSVTVQGESTVSSVTCTFLEVGLAGGVGPGTATCSNTCSLSFGSILDATTLTAPALDSTYATVVNCTITIAGAVDAEHTQFTGGTLQCASINISGCDFSGGFQLTATTVTSDAQSWILYLSQGGLPNGATVTITGQAATAFTSSAGFPQNLVVTPAVSPGTPILAFNVTPTQTGVFDVSGAILVTTGTAEAPGFGLYAAPGSATGGLSAGTDALFGDTGNPLTVPAGGTLYMTYQNLPAALAAIGAMSTTIAAHVGRPVRAATCLWIQAISISGTTPWTFSANLRAKEDSLN
jgi:hypothetical protein